MSQPCPQINGRDLRELMENAQLPVLPQGAPHLLRAMSDSTMDFHQLAQVIEKFPSIAARLIALANSSWSSPVVPVTSLEMACSRLGFAVVRSVAIALSIASIFNPHACPAFDPIRYWTGALLTAEIAHALADQAHLEEETDPQSVRTAGLLHNLGLLWLAAWFPAETHSALLITADPGHGLDADEALTAELGFGYREAGACLAEAWRFPPALVFPIRYHCDPDYDGEAWQAAGLVGLARRLIEEEEEGRLHSADQACQRVGVAPADCDPIRESLPERREDLAELAGMLFG